jgi:hypothetical protein
LNLHEIDTDFILGFVHKGHEFGEDNGEENGDICCDSKLPDIPRATIYINLCGAQLPSFKHMTKAASPGLIHKQPSVMKVCR